MDTLLGGHIIRWTHYEVDTMASGSGNNFTCSLSCFWDYGSKHERNILTVVTCLRARVANTTRLITCWSQLEYAPDPDFPEFPVFPEFQGLLARPPLPHAPGARMTVVHKQTPSNDRDLYPPPPPQTFRCRTQTHYTFFTTPTNIQQQPIMDIPPTMP